MAEIILKRGREKSLLQHHPWIFSGSIENVNGSINPGGTVDVISNDGQFLAKAAYNPSSQIAGRVWTWDSMEEITQDFFELKLKNAINLRHEHKIFLDTSAFRLVHGESDGLPGLIVDQYGEVIVVQYLTAGAEYWRESISEILISDTHCKVLYERSDVNVRKLEGLEQRKGLLFGETFDNKTRINENAVDFRVDIINGHKTGFYLDQRENREFTRKISGGRKVLDCFAYTGGFAVNAMIGKASSITLIDSSEEVLTLARENFSLNNIDLTNVNFVNQDVFKHLRLLRDKGERYDLIILDPPKFAPTIAQVDRASRGYKDINLLALKLLNDNGLLLSFSCSGGVSEELFQKIITGAAVDAGVHGVILKRLHQAVDHPVGLNFPEGAYLKGFLIQRVS